MWFGIVSLLSIAVAANGDGEICLGCPINPNRPVCWDPRCSQPGAPAGCNVGGQEMNCRFCDYDPILQHCAATPGPGTTQRPCTGCPEKIGRKLHLPSLASSNEAVTTENEAVTTENEAVTTRSAVVPTIRIMYQSEDLICWDPRCSEPGAPAGCDAGGVINCRFCYADPSLTPCNALSSPTVPPTTTTASTQTSSTRTTTTTTTRTQTQPTPTSTEFPVPNCEWEQFLYSQCSRSQRYYCPSTSFCSSRPDTSSCPGVCYLSDPPPYPPRPSSQGHYSPGRPTPQSLTCGPRLVVNGTACAAQPTKANCAVCPASGTWRPSKFQCGHTLANTPLCPVQQLQSRPAREAPDYQPPSWAPPLPNAHSFCDTRCDCRGKDEKTCVGCCTWDRGCKNFWQKGKADQCLKVSPRWNWIITSCDTMGGVSGGAACAQNPFSTVDVRYISAYQLARKSSGDFVWSIVPESSLNWAGERELVDFSALPTELDADGTPVRSCSGGGGDWNAAYFPYKTNGLTPPAMLFVLSYKRFYNAAWFMLNQRVLDSGPNVPTTSSMNNCWGGIGAVGVDFLESPNIFPPDLRQSRADWNVFRATSSNGAGRCFACNHASQNGSFNAAGCGGAPAGSYYVGDSDPHLWAAVIDARGTTLYKDPVWPGLGESCSAPELESLHPEEPEAQQPCTDPGETCAIYLPGCLA